MRLLNILFVPFLGLLSQVQSKEISVCTLKLGDSSYAPHVFDKFQHNYRFITGEKTRGGTLRINNGRSVTLTCHTNVFTTRDLPAGTNTITATCRNDPDPSKNVLLTAGDTQVVYDPTRHSLLCDKQIIQYYAYDVFCCGSTGVLAGFINALTTNSTGYQCSAISNETEVVKIIEYCYDKKIQRVNWAKYLVASRSPYISAQKDYNLGTSAEDDLPHKCQEIDLYPGDLESLLLPSKQKKLFEWLGPFLGDQTFTSTHLVPPEHLPPHYAVTAKGYLNKDIQWTGLKEGNARLVHLDIRALIPENAALVYAGTSKTISVKDSSNQEKLLQIYYDNLYTDAVRIPYYYWWVVKVKKVSDCSCDDDTEFGEPVVIVSINNPFLKLSEIKDSVFCTDVCDEIPWLQKLKRTRKIPTYGYTFCCKINDAIRNIPEIPKCLAVEEEESSEESVEPCYAKKSFRKKKPIELSRKKSVYEESESEQSYEESDEGNSYEKYETDSEEDYSRRPKFHKYRKPQSSSYDSKDVSDGGFCASHKI